MLYLREVSLWLCITNTFKSLWDEWLGYRPVLQCNCGAMLQCTCELLKIVAKTQEKDVVIKFLVGLDDNYCH